MSWLPACLPCGACLLALVPGCPPASGAQLTQPPPLLLPARSPKNTYQDQAGQTACIWCPAGSSTESQGSSACDACPLGSYSPAINKPCMLAPAGAYVPTTGATSFLACPAGSYTSDTGNSECSACSPGTFSPNSNSTACTKCPAGTKSEANATSCTAW